MSLNIDDFPFDELIKGKIEKDQELEFIKKVTRQVCKMVDAKRDVVRMTTKVFETYASIGMLKRPFAVFPCTNAVDDSFSVLFNGGILLFNVDDGELKARANP